MPPPEPQAGMVVNPPWSTADEEPPQMLERYKSSQVTFIYIALLNNTNCDKATAQYQNGKIVSIM